MFQAEGIALVVEKSGGSLIAWFLPIKKIIKICTRLANVIDDVDALDAAVDHPILGRFYMLKITGVCLHFLYLTTLYFLRIIHCG